MTAKCTVVSIKDSKTAVVCAERKSACAECHANGGKSCGACDIFLGDDRFTSDVDNSIGANVGDTVMVESPSGYVIGTAALLFLLPLVVAALFYGIVFLITSEYAPIGAICGVVLSYSVIFAVEKATKKKTNKMKIVKIINEKSDGIYNAE